MVSDFDAVAGAVADALKRRDGIIGAAAVAAGGEKVGVRANDGDGFDACFIEGKNIVLVGEQDDGLPGDFKGERRGVRRWR